MKKIEAIIKPYKLEEVKDALGEWARGDDGDRGERIRAAERAYGDFSRQRIHRGFSAENQDGSRGGGDRADNAVAAVVKSARTGKIGDGKIFIATIEQAVRIRTEETGDEAI